MHRQYGITIPTTDRKIGIKPLVFFIDDVRWTIRTVLISQRSGANKESQNTTHELCDCIIGLCDFIWKY